MSSGKSILVLTPWVPYPPTGADQQDRYERFLLLQSLGYDVRVIAKVHAFQDQKSISEAFANIHIPLVMIPYVRSQTALLLKNLGKVLNRPALLDGAALEYIDPVYIAAVEKMIAEWKPDVAFIDFCFLWPLYAILKKHGIPVIMRSANNEAQMAIDEHGGSLLSRVKAIPKFWTEKIVARESDMLLAITPAEEVWYRRLGSTQVAVLPLSGLPLCLEQRTHTQKDVLNVVFLSSNYSMRHNRDALKFVLKHIIPLARQRMPGRLKFFLTGKKFPPAFKKYLAEDTESVGFVEDLGALLRTMDIAVCPWITGQGMQQKVFEPLCRSIPLLTTKVGGYPFVDGTDVLFCRTPEEYVDGLLRFTDHTVRNSFSQHAYAKAEKLFGTSAQKEILKSAIENVVQSV